jgi:hypothetical protein
LALWLWSEAWLEPNRSVRILMQGRFNARKGTSMDRRTLLLGLLGGLAAAPMIVAATSSVEATPLPEAVAPAYQPLPEPASTVTEADPNAVRADWSQYWRRRRRRFYRRHYRRRFRRRFY